MIFNAPRIVQRDANKAFYSHIGYAFDSVGKDIAFALIIDEERKIVAIPITIFNDCYPTVAIANTIQSIGGL